jgi:hypothetical protein
MKSSYIKLTGIAFGAILSLCVVLQADAQRGVRGSFGGGVSGGGGGGAMGGGGRVGGGGSLGGGGITNGRPAFGAGANAAGRNNTAVNPRTNAVGGAGVSGARPAYRSYPGLPSGTNRITGRAYNGYYNYHGYYNRYYMPRLGYSLGMLPFGYYPFFWGGNPYFFSGGLFYQYNNNQYTVVEPPMGAAIKNLPDNAQSIVINGAQYYELNGVYYEPITRDDGSVVYQVAGKDGVLNTDEGAMVQNQQQQMAPAMALPKIGDTTRSLPSDARKVSINGQKFYVTADGYYYQESIDNDNNRSFKVVGTPDDELNR